jgi:hypothetical protein
VDGVTVRIKALRRRRDWPRVPPEGVLLQVVSRRRADNDECPEALLSHASGRCHRGPPKLKARRIAPTGDEVACEVDPVAVSGAVSLVL